ncbi:hypothetical protein Tco_0912528 [Tanacetum coccineum]
MALPPHDQRHQYLRYEGLQYKDADILDFESRLTRIYRREVYKTVGFGAYWAKSERQINDKGDLRDYWIGISSARDFLGIALSYTAIWDPILRLCHRLIACSITGKSQAPKKVLTVITPALPGIDMAKMVRLFTDLYGGADTWDRLFRTQTSYPQQPPPPPPPAATRNLPQRIARLEEDVHEIHEALVEQRKVIGAMARDFSRFTVWAADGIAQALIQPEFSYTLYFETPHLPY